MDDFAAEDVSEAYAVIGLYGERARSLVAGATVQEIPDAGHFTVSRTEAGEIVTLRDTRLNGAGGFLLLVPRGELESILAKLGALGATPMERATYETLRVENGIPSPGRELTETYNPLEAGLTTLISWTKGCYIGQEVIARLDSYDKVQRHLVGLTLDGTPESDGIEDLEIESPDDGKRIGRVTSLAYSPELGHPIALGYVRTQYAIPGTRVGLVAAGEGGGPIAGATITRLPFDL
jgi:aminomethyltransferase